MSIIQELIEKQREKMSGGAERIESSESPGTFRAASIARGLSSVAKLILASDARSHPEDVLSSREALARTLGVEIEDVNEVITSIEESHGEGAWKALVVEERTRLAMESAPLRASAWDRIESLAVQKLGLLVEQNRVNKASELLAIASVANKALRHDKATPSNHNGQGGQAMPGVNIFMQQVAGGQGTLREGEELQSGNLGTMRLSLSPRIQKQLSAPSIDSHQVLSNSKMLDVKELRHLSDEGVDIEVAIETEIEAEVEDV